MYLYTFILTYVGTDPFMKKLWTYLTRGTDTMPISYQMTPAQATALKPQVIAAGFDVLKATRVPVTPPPEDVTGQA